MTSNDLSMKNNRDLLLMEDYLQYIPSLMVKQHLVLKILCLQGFTRFSDFDLWWPHMTIDLHEKQYKLSTHQVLPIIPSLKTRHHLLLEILCLQTFLHANFDLWWPQMTFDLLCEKQHRATWSTHLGLPTYQVWSQATFNSWDTHVYKVLQSFQTLTSGDLKWPLTSMKNNTESSTHHDVLPTCQVWRSGKFYFLRYRVVQVCVTRVLQHTCPLVTSNDLWPLYVTSDSTAIGIIYSPSASTNVLSLKFKHHSNVKVCVQDSLLTHNLTTVSPMATKLGW